MADPVKAVENAAGEIKDTVVEEGKSFFGSLLSAPIDLVKGIAGTLWGTATGGIKGLFGGVFGNLYNTLLTTGGIFLSTQIVPDLVAWLPLKIKGKNVGHIMAEHAQEDFGFAALISFWLYGGDQFPAVAQRKRAREERVGGEVMKDELVQRLDRVLAYLQAHVPRKA